MRIRSGLLASTVDPSRFGGMTAAERAAGRFMRAPDEHTAAAETTSTETTETAAETPAEETTLVTDTETTDKSTEQSSTDETTETSDDKATEEQTEEAKTEGAPEEYADFTMPEGIELDPEITDEFKTVAKELNLSQENAQKLVELGAKMREKDVEAIVGLRAQWVEDTKADPEIGGDKLDATLGVARRAVNAYGSEAFTKLLNESGLGNHPEVVRFMAKVGATVSEDKVVRGSKREASPTESMADRIYSKPKAK